MLESALTVESGGVAGLFCLQPPLSKTRKYIIITIATAVPMAETPFMIRMKRSAPIILGSPDIDESRNTDRTTIPQILPVIHSGTILALARLLLPYPYPFPALFIKY
jgi:hypothetical protein